MGVVTAIVVTLVLVGCVVVLWVLVDNGVLKFPGSTVGEGKSCSEDSQCDALGAICYNKPTGICSGPGGKFQNGGICAIVEGKRVTSPEPAEKDKSNSTNASTATDVEPGRGAILEDGVCNPGHFCGRADAKCYAIGTEIGALCADDVPGSCSHTSTGTPLKCSFGKCVLGDIPKKSVKWDGECTLDDQCIDWDSTTEAPDDTTAHAGAKTQCCMKPGATTKKCRHSKKGKGNIWYCPDDTALLAIDKAVGNVVDSVTKTFDTVGEGALCGVGSGTCDASQNLVCCLGHCRVGKKDPIGLLMCDLSADPEKPPYSLGHECAAHTDCKNWGPGGVGCCKGKCTTLKAGFLGIKSCP